MSFRWWLTGPVGRWQCSLEAKVQVMLGQEKTPWGQAQCKLLHHCATPPLRVPGFGGWQGAPQPCDQHQACSDMGQAISDFSSLSGGQRSWQVPALLGHSTRSKNGTGSTSSPPQCRRPSHPCPSPCSGLDPSQRGNPVISTRYFRKSKTSRQTVPLVKSLYFRAGWCEMLSCGSSWVKKQMVSVCYGVSASEALGWLKWWLTGAKQDREMNDVFSQYKVIAFLEACRNVFYIT